MDLGFPRRVPGCLAVCIHDRLVRAGVDQQLDEVLVALVRGEVQGGVTPFRGLEVQRRAACVQCLEDVHAVIVCRVVQRCAPVCTRRRTAQLGLFAAGWRSWLAGGGRAGAYCCPGC